MSKSRPIAPVRLAVLAVVLTVVSFVPSTSMAQYSIGDTLTVIQKPLLNIPSIVFPGQTLDIDCEAAPLTTGWQAWLASNGQTVPLTVTSAAYSPSTLWWRLEATVPADLPCTLYDLHVSADGGILDGTHNAVRVIPSFRDDWYFIQITDTHMPTHKYYYQSGAETDSTEMEDMREVLKDINLVNPEFVLMTGDLVNEGELEDFLLRRYYSRAQGILGEFEVPVFLVSGNHDLGGWDDTPPSDGTARRDWWRFFGWKRLDSPPAGAPWYTQNYSFDYGPVHFTGLEAYNNYDSWRYYIYGSDSFTDGQMNWLANDVAAAAGSTSKVAFYHYDFDGEVDLPGLDIDIALAGHVHNDGRSGRFYTTESVCDGERAWRVVKVSNGELDVRSTLSSGSDGNNLTVSYSPANDGTAEAITATVNSSLAEGFANALVKFVMPAGLNNFAITGGVLVEREIGSETQICHVEFDLPANGSRQITIEGQVTDVPDTPAALKLGLGNHPNPFNPVTTVSFTLSEAGSARLAVFDARGQQIALLADGSYPAGDHDVRWDGRDQSGQTMPSGVYFARLDTGAGGRTHKLVLAR